MEDYENWEEFKLSWLEREFYGRYKMPNGTFFDVYQRGDGTYEDLYGTEITKAELKKYDLVY